MAISLEDLKDLPPAAYDGMVCAKIALMQFSSTPRERSRRRIMRLLKYTAIGLFLIGLYLA